MYLPTYVRSLAAKLEVSGRVVATRCCFGKFTYLGKTCPTAQVGGGTLSLRIQFV